jgi:hypothetical protein
MGPCYLFPFYSNILLGSWAQWLLAIWTLNNMNPHELQIDVVTLQYCDSPSLLQFSVDAMALFNHCGRVTDLLARPIY